MLVCFHLLQGVVERKLDDQTQRDQELEIREVSRWQEKDAAGVCEWQLSRTTWALLGSQELKGKEGQPESRPCLASGGTLATLERTG